MQVVRKITYTGSEEQLVRQLQNSLPDGVYPGWCTHVRVATLECPNETVAAAIAEDHGRWQGNLEKGGEASGLE